MSTVKSTIAASERHVHRNLRAGADHIVLFVDDADPSLCRHWEEHPHVTAVPTGEAYWGGDRPDGLALRQGINANLVNLALTAIPEVSWLFSLDDDECLHIDKAQLLGLDESVRVVRLTTWEAGSRAVDDADPVVWYKRPLDDEELEMLVLLGALDEPHPGRYFRGHRKKIGVRPNRRMRMFLHHVENMQGKKVPMHADPDALRVLHDESPTLDEFIRKWSAHVSGGGYHASAQRRAIRSVFVALAENENADPESVRAVQERLYQRVAVDDMSLLRTLGLLVSPEPDRHAYQPRSLGADEQSRMTAMLQALVKVDKSLLSHVPRPRPVQALREARKHVGGDHQLDQRLQVLCSTKQARIGPHA